MNLIYDYETLGTDPSTCAVCSLAMLKYDEDRFLSIEPYTFQELVNSAYDVKFDIIDQVKNYGRIIEKSTLEWWQEQPKELRNRVLEPSDKDISISELFDVFVKFIGYDKIDLSYTRGNTFDPVITFHLLKITNPSVKSKLHDQLHHWSTVRDVRTFIATMAYGVELSTTFIPDGLESEFEAHNPIHDIAMDVMRMQSLVRNVYEDKVVPF